MSGRTDRKALLLLVLGASIIGAGTVLVRLTGTGAAAAGWWRLVLAVPWLACLTGYERRTGRARQGLGAPLGVLALCALAFALDLVCWHYSLHLTSIANSTVLANLTPVIVTILAWLLFRERPQAMFLAGLTLSLSGAVTMALSHGGARGAHPALGDLMAVLASACYAVYFIVVRRARETASAIQVMLASSVMGAPLMLAATLLFGERLLPLTAGGWAACAALGVMHVSGQGAIAYSLGKVPTALAAVVVLVQPVVAAITGWAVFGEAVGPVQALGGLLALAGIGLAQAAARRAPPIAREAEAAAA